MLLICLRDRAALPGGCCDGTGEGEENRVPAPAAHRGENSTTRDKRPYRA
jgi:hypothetical protein